MAKGPIKKIAENRKARHNYEILETLEVGLVLVGSEVKSLRQSRVTIKDAFVRFVDREAWLVNAHINHFKEAGPQNHDVERHRKLLMSKKQLRTWQRNVAEKGYSIVPLKLYFHGALVKMEIGLARGRKDYDKRHHLKEKQDKREMARAMRKKY